jgi:hypothetical protein
MYASCMTPTEKTEKASRVPAAYMVLVQTGAGAWTEVDEFYATTAQEARRAASKTIEGDTFVAVPVRSWKPRTRNVQQVTKESWS